MLLTQVFEGTDVTIINDGCFEIMALSNHRIDKSALSFLEDTRFLNELIDNKNISCVICSPDLVEYLKPRISGIAVAEQPRVAFFRLHNRLCQKKDYLRSSFCTTIGKNCMISTLAYIDSENVRIGDNVIIEEFVSIRGHCIIGSDTKIRSGTQIGGDGFEYKEEDFSLFPVAHAGGISIGKNVEVLPCSSIHKAVYPWDNTEIGDETKISSQAHIDHGSKIGRRVKICAGAIISGRVSIGDGAFIGPNCVVANRIEIGANTRVTMGAAVTKNVKEGTIVSGNFAIDHNRFLQNLKKSVMKS